MGKISRIQLRGISRTPSDRLTTDGGCAESLNVSLDNTELAPAFVPDDVTGKLGLPDNLQAEKVFVHKTLHYTNVVYVAGGKVMHDGKELLTLDGVVKDITSIGNVIVVATDANLHYLLYSISDKTYAVQGSSVPLPTLLVTSRESGEVTKTYEITKEYTTSQPDQEKMFGEEWNDLDKDGKNVNLYAAQMASYLRAEFEEYASVQSAYTKPIVMRYAIRLYNGTTLITSVPYLVGGAYVSGFKNIIAQYEWDEMYDDNDNPRNEEKISVTVTTGSYRPYVKLLDFSDEDMKSWKEIVKTIEVYMSAQVEPDLAHVQVYETRSAYDEASAIIGMGTDESAKERLLERSLFYKVAEYDLEKEEDIAMLREGVTLDVIKKEEDLVNNHDRLDPAQDNMVPDSVFSSKVSTFNAALLLAGVSTRVSTGAKTMAAVEGIDADGNAWTVRYFIAGPSGSADVLGRNEEGLPYFAGPKAYSWVVHPNVNCTKAVVCSDYDMYVEIPMEKHPYLPCSYGWLGRLPLADYMKEGQQEAEHNRLDPENNTLASTNKVYLSEIENPYIFPVARRYTFQSEVLNTAIATTALSQGQFGQFPLYVFTEDGIWAMEIAADGSFVTSKPMSRDVCTNPASITSIDNAVVFVTDKGVMLLQGSQVVNISSYMHGKHYAIEETAKVIVKGQPFFCDYLDILADTTPFMTFMKKASIAYDYAGSRLICIAPDEKYQYIYKLDTQTWHKTAHNINLLNPINSYPECLVQGKERMELEKIYCRVIENDAQEGFDYIAEQIRKVLPDLTNEEIDAFLNDGAAIDMTFVPEDDGEWLYNMFDYLHIATELEIKKETVEATRIYDLSTILDAHKPQKTERAIIATRPFNLEAPDVLKTITDVQIRGDFPKGAVKFMLLGSMDGINFYTISTKRGKSWKMFRLIILADLEAHDRISWADINFETRFTNRLR